MRFTAVSPRLAALHMLQGAFGLDVIHGNVPLADFQKEAVSRALRILRHRNGVLIADGTGMGKTFVGLAIAEQLASTHQAVVLAPAAVCRMWRQEIRKRGLLPIPVITHQALALGRRPAFRPRLIIIDEAHGFRNPHTRRYRALQAIAEGAAVVMLSATPINNSLSDLYHLLSLFCGDGAFRDLGVGSLRAALNGDDVRLDDIERIRSAVVIRRSRADVRDATSSAISFPSTAVTQSITYAPTLSFQQAQRFIESLCFPAHGAGDSTCSVSPELLRFALLKRLDSSLHSIRISLRRQIHFYEQFVDALHAGSLLHPRMALRMPAEDEGVFQLMLTDLIAIPREALDEMLLHRSEAELALLREWHSCLPTHDDKLEKLAQLLRLRRNEKTIVFSEYRDTARYLWRKLRSEFSAGLIDGSGAWLGNNASHRREVVECFAPLANGARTHLRDRCSVLFATDVLAEGLNLQDAGAVVSYDLPWNPVRLIQRFGRVDRIGSPHDRVIAYNFMPDRDLDSMLRLIRRLQSKVETLRHVIGHDGPVLESELLDAREEASWNWAQLRAHLDAPAAVPGIPVGSMGSRRTYVSVQRGSDWTLFEHCGERLQELRHPPADLFQRALSTRSSSPTDLEKVSNVTGQVLAELRSRNDLGESGPASPAALIARLIRKCASHLPFGESNNVYTKTDETLAALARVTSSHADVALRRIAGQQYGSLVDLLDAVSAALSDITESAGATVEWSVTGVLTSD